MKTTDMQVTGMFNESQNTVIKAIIAALFLRIKINVDDGAGDAGFKILTINNHTDVTVNVCGTSVFRNVITKLYNYKIADEAKRSIKSVGYDCCVKTQPVKPNDEMSTVFEGFMNTAKLGVNGVTIILHFSVDFSEISKIIDAAESLKYLGYEIDWNKLYSMIIEDVIAGRYYYDEDSI